jgi:rhodanese-related sulfurtransferase
MKLFNIISYALLFATAIYASFVFIFGCQPEWVIAYAGDAEPGLYTTPTELKKMMGQGEQVYVYDMRSADAYRTAHIPGSLNVRAGKLPDHIRELPDDATAVIVCTCGVKSRQALEGYSQGRGITVKYLYGGMAYWNMLDNRWVRPLWGICT